jgi:integrase
MDPRALLDTWLASSTLRPSTQAAYRQEVTSWLGWCEQSGTDPYTIGIEHIARWCDERYLRPYLGTRPFDGPDALAHLADESPEAAKSHDRRITALTQYYGAIADRGILHAAPDLTMLRSGVDRDADTPKRLTPMERAVFLTVVGMWGKDQARHYLRDRLIAYLLLEGLRPAEVVRVDMRHLYEQPDYSYQVRAPDDFENVGKQFILEPLTGAALKAYLPHRPRPAEGVHALILGQGGRPIVSRYPNMLIRQIAATHPLLAQRTPPVTADAIAHTGFWDTPQQADG